MKLFARRDVPEADRVIVAAGESTPAIGGEGHGKDFIGMTLETTQRTASGYVPEPDRLIRTAGKGAAAIWGEGDAQDEILMSRERSDLGADYRQYRSR